jgi:hypothetical protein
VFLFALLVLCDSLSKPNVEGVKYTSNCFLDIEAVLATTKKRLSREKIKCKDKKSVQQMIEERLWPAGGLHELRSHVETGWCYYDSLVALSQAGCCLSSSQLAFAFRYTIASLYSFEENARAMALEKTPLSGM